MAKQRQTLLLCLILIGLAVRMARGVDQGPEAVENWFGKLSQAKEKVTKLHFYVHDIVSGPSPTAVQVAQANVTFTSSRTSFGLINMGDDPLTVGPEPTSKIVGRAQGVYGSADQNDVGLLMYMNIFFTEGKYKGSTLSILGRNAALKVVREMSIVGGTGVFRLARGIVTSRTYYFNTTTLDAILEYNVMVTHY